VNASSLFAPALREFRSFYSGDGKLMLGWLAGWRKENYKKNSPVIISTLWKKGHVIPYRFTNSTHNLIEIDSYILKS